MSRGPVPLLDVPMEHGMAEDGLEGRLAADDEAACGKLTPRIPIGRDCSGPTVGETIPMTMESLTSFHNPSIQGAAKAGKRERSFALSLPALVKGLDAAGRRFEEHSAICGISAQEASFRLRAPVLIGARVTLALDIPRTLMLERSLKLVVSGSVVFVQSEKENGKTQIIVARLDRGFRLHPDLLSPA
jgi:hypothetical protein